jgi:hypothetical protein
VVSCGGKRGFVASKKFMSFSMKWKKNSRISFVRVFYIFNDELFARYWGLVGLESGAF